jgi:phosphoribosyl 1,2-cyclic phosphodiesterase/CheY-like chemotaxis protein
MKKQDIVFIDDDPMVSALAKSWLEQQGFTVHVASDGLAGLELVQRLRPRLVFSDLMMPRMHGFELCSKLRSAPLTKHTPVIIVSSKSYESDERKALECGASDYLVKPFQSKDMAERIAMLLRSNQVRVRFWGTRGSIATPGANNLKYGGNTSCVEVRFDDEIVLFDCGTGARDLGVQLAQEFHDKPLKAHIFISHTHWDHIQGFPFFSPAYVPGNQITVYSLRGADKSLQKVFTGQMDATYFPVSLGDMRADIQFREIESDVTIGAAKISHMYLNHPGIAIGFRLEVHGKVVVYVTDHEPYVRLSGKNEFNERQDLAVTEFGKNADLYIREAQYTNEEYESKRGWGHSTLDDAVATAHQSSAKLLSIYHHDPMHDDETLDRLGEHCRARISEIGGSFELKMASDDLEVNL